MRINHDLGSLIDGLTTLEKVQLPDAARRALYETGPHMRAFHRREMASVLEDPVAYTLRSPRYKVDAARLSLTLSISEDGSPQQSPAHYLQPVFRQEGRTLGTALTTRFARRLQRAGQIPASSYLVPQPKARLALTRRGKMSQRVYQSALAALQSNEYASRYTGADTYFAIKPGDRSGLDSGIYRSKGRTISRLFALLDEPPSVPRIYDWREATIDEAVDQLEGRIKKNISYLLTK